MSKQELIDKLRTTIGNSERRKVPYMRTSNGKDSLHIYTIDNKNAAEAVYDFLIKQNLINE